MYSFDTQLRVRYGETDQMGYLYYGNYAQYFEVGRVETMRSLGMSYRDLEVEHGILMPVMSMQVRYIRPAFYDDLLTIKTAIRHLPEKTITFYSEIYNEKNKLINGGEVKLCFVDAKSNKTIPVPDVILEPLRKYFID
ncbi:MAG: acyl-CoA thioesterase [Saprospiraceae bacterium]|nr:acyl-CoA thioesterase [Saprospiraceae bacterium]